MVACAKWSPLHVRKEHGKADAQIIARFPTLTEGEGRVSNARTVLKVCRERANPSWQFPRTIRGDFFLLFILYYIPASTKLIKNSAPIFFEDISNVALRFFL